MRNMADPIPPERDASGAEQAVGARMAAILFLVVVAATVVSVVTRLTVDPDQPTLLESMNAIAEGRGLYYVAALARVAAGLALMAGGWCLFRVWNAPANRNAQLVLVLFAASGIATALSGVSSAALATLVPVIAVSVVAGPGETVDYLFPAPVAAFDYLRWVAGKAGYALAGLGLIAAGWRQATSSGIHRLIAPVSIVIGVAMQFIWVDAATVMHRISGPAFLVWLTAMAVLLLANRTATVATAQE